MFRAFVVRVAAVVADDCPVSVGLALGVALGLGFALLAQAAPAGVRIREADRVNAPDKSAARRPTATALRIHCPARD